MIVKKPNTFVLDLGGSVFAPNSRAKGIDIAYLKQFEKFIRKQVALKRRFFIVTGGGYVAREYRDAAAAAVGGKIADEDLDWLGVHATRLNAHLFRTIFRDIAYPWILKHYDLVDKKVTTPVVVCGGWKPGWSTDYCSVLVAADYHIDTVISLTNVDYAYDKDPNKYKGAKPIKTMGWDEMIKLVGKKWRPGMNTPFDPVASREAKKFGLKVVIANGRKFANLERILDGKTFTGTVIE
ncbi:MAG: Aspartate/glutamate/uridylate kinase [Candidatus Beckwithbacteria bacterium GW2011_GWB1_47_15]|uniref:UMP kinase n=1 Tax=Candidatus Beckwithbacteria bacterium GW2011_GWB1_47_15 TaxID=1618371 RepID=A0A0G1RV33_9BACT|nr:MAG: putative uridylate kinase, uridylate kinase [Candidatus Beckwithbacteria bacterium GW2011_GWC1_49_16]KKU35464.1 MAG: Aspartate/glutamate/uridylate kinase [Candidatus Beckwithbacteria bacterium GW2011_GWA1_46_30]KKU61139.1 MAG: Aspartate/glutamate/uridylate kinase [Candidatus Beckwithbacteria bacterium GW2011_GWB1_47_15]KKU71978.1 MAG: Aspartate/glutamate/uridylate kinase [Candidatus Beckwithbacteria bacterium GW2011_GWA2_47_25]KKW03215.1 MAG: Aspartate/glutamate/uridylate kinase [Candid